MKKNKELTMLDLYLNLIDSVNQNVSGNKSGEDRLKIVDEIIEGLRNRGPIN